VRVALVGYTNVGKSTIMNMLSKENIYAKDELFATVDSTVRKVVINTIPFLLSDTVGFIRKLPHDLIESFKSTLDEVREADVLLHVVDISHPSFEEHMEVVQDTLGELGVADKETIVVYNKIDQLSSAQDEETFDFSTGIDTTTNNKTNIFISAVKKTNQQDFRRLLYDVVKKHHMKIYPNYLAPEYY
jgi:GTP-binding protein HflX